jgi:hypothetical protein
MASEGMHYHLVQVRNAYFLSDMAPPPIKDKIPLSGEGKEAWAGRESNVEQSYNFRFVGVGEDTRSTIRSHVMKDYYEKKDNRRQPSTAPQLSSAASQKEGVLQQSHRFKVGPKGLQEVKAGRKKSKSTSRSTKKITNDAQNISKLEDANSGIYLSSQITSHKKSESVTSATAGHRHQQGQGEPTSHRQWSVATATPETITIGDALLSQQGEAHSRNIVPREKIYSISGAIDPFGTLPTLCVPRSEHLLHHG